MRKLDVDMLTNCGAAMLRVFIELSVDEYSAREGIKGYSIDKKLFQKLRIVADYMVQNSILDETKLKEVRVAHTNPNSLFSTHTLNAYLHNKDFSPKPSELF